MIKGSELLNGCKSQTVITANALDANFNSEMTVTSGFRNNADQIRIYKEKFKDNYLKYMPKSSAHEDGLAFDSFIKNIDPAKIYVWALNNAAKYSIWGIGFDPFLGYCHIDNKDRGTGKITKWIYRPDGTIFYL